MRSTSARSWERAYFIALQKSRNRTKSEQIYLMRADDLYHLAKRIARPDFILIQWTGYKKDV